MKMTYSILAATLFCGISYALNAQVTFQHVRNATSKITYGDVTFLIDPMLAEKGRYPGFEQCFNPEIRNPSVDLPMSVEELMKDVDAVIVSHTHLDHWDDVAQNLIRKDIKLFVQDAKDESDIRGQGFTNIEILGAKTEFKGVTLSYVEGTHGTQAMYDIPAIAQVLGNTMGFVFSKPGEKTTYVMGDTVWTPRVTKTLLSRKPDIIVMNTGYARMLGVNEGIIMGTEDVAKAAKICPSSTIITVHMDAISHMSVTRRNMRDFVRIFKLEKQVKIPEDGETLTF